MNAVETIERVIHSDLLSRNLTEFPVRGATEPEIAEEEERLGTRLCADHVTLLRRWNGITLDVIRFYGCGSSCTVGRMADLQMVPDELAGEATAVGSDPAGFVYLQSNDGRIFSLDTDGGGVKFLAASIDDLVCRLVFGSDAESFAGIDWLNELRHAGIVC
jgi:hypothetical protein